MRIVVPYVGEGLAGETVVALAAHARDGLDRIRFVELTDDEAYWRLLHELWAEQRDVVLVEQDIVIHEGVLDGFDRCTNPWCTHGYRYEIYAGFSDYHGAGCVRWRAELMAAHPDLLDVVATRFGPRHPAKHWCSLDAFTQLELQARGVQQCKHQPPVGHTSVTPSHDCAQTF